LRDQHPGDWKGGGEADVAEAGRRILGKKGGDDKIKEYLEKKRREKNTRLQK